MINIELELVKLNDGRYTIDLGNDCEIEITVDENAVGVEIKSNTMTWECSASADQLKG